VNLDFIENLKEYQNLILLKNWASTVVRKEMEILRLNTLVVTCDKVSPMRKVIKTTAYS
jgi:hypothetical protein